MRRDYFAAMAEMQRARLIPVSGIGSAQEAEQRATSALLAVISIVRPFSESLLAPLGASRAKKAEVEAFTEVEAKLPSGQKVRPDGLIRVTYGSSSWSALVEVKTGDANLEAEQLNNYLIAAKEVGAEAVVTISNEIGVAGAHPTDGLKIRSNSKVKVHHFSWMRILAIAVQNRVHTGVDDPEQAWILGELIRYLEHPSSGASELSDMGPSWVTVRDGARDRSLMKAMSEVADIAGRWDQLIRQAALNLSSETGADVTQWLPRAQQDPKARTAMLCENLAEAGQLSADLRIPGTVGDLEIVGDIRARQIVASTTIEAPGDKKGRGSVSWLTRQIKAAPPDTVIEAYALRARTPTTATLGEALEDPTLLVADGQTDIAKFRIIRRSDAGQSGRTGGKKFGFIETVNRAIEGFYQLVLQQITPWVPPAPKVSRPPQVDTAPQPSDRSLSGRGELLGRPAPSSQEISTPDTPPASPEQGPPASRPVDELAPGSQPDSNW